MVDVKELYKSEYVNVNLVKDKNNPIAVVVGSGKVVTNEYGKQRLELPVEIEEDSYFWSINKTSFDRINEVHGSETKKWVGKKFSLSIENASNGMEMVVGNPI